MNITVAEVLHGHGNIPFLEWFGLTPKFDLLCGECGVSFKTNFKISECNNRNPHVPCKSCGSINVVPIFWNGEEVQMDREYLEIKREIMEEAW